MQNKDSAILDYTDQSQARWPSIKFQYKMYVGGITCGELERGAIYLRNDVQVHRWIHIYIVHGRRLFISVGFAQARPNYLQCPRVHSIKPYEWSHAPDILPCLLVGFPCPQLHFYSFPRYTPVTLLPPLPLTMIPWLCYIASHSRPLACYNFVNATHQ